MNATYNYFYNLDTFLIGGAYVKTTTSTTTKQTFSNSIRQKFIQLGWKKSWIYKRLKNITDDILNDYNENSIVIQFSLVWFNKSKCIYSNNLTTIFLSIGLNKQLALQLQSILQPLQNTCYTNSQLVETGIEYILGKFKPIYSISQSYLFETIPENAWTNYNIQKHKTIQIMNVSYSCNEDIYTCMKHNLTTLQDSNHSTLFYHTTASRFFRSISRNIQHSYGKKCQDFGFTSGFYVSQNIYDCLDWGYKKRHLLSNEICIFVFSIPNILPQIYTYTYLQDDEWLNIVSISRKCDIDEVDDKTFDIMTEIDTQDFVYGNMCSNPNKVIQGKIPKTHNPPKKQLVSKTTNADRYLQDRMIACIFLKKV